MPVQHVVQCTHGGKRICAGTQVPAQRAINNIILLMVRRRSSSRQLHECSSTVPAKSSQTTFKATQKKKRPPYTLKSGTTTHTSELYTGILSYAPDYQVVRNPATRNLHPHSITPCHRACAVKAAARDTGSTAKQKASLKRDKYSRTGTGACRFVSLSHETFGRAGPAAVALLYEIAEFAATSGFLSKRIFLENAMRDLSATLC